MAICLSYIDFAADNGFYPCFFSCHVEIDSTIHCPMVSNGKAIHAQFLGFGNKLWNTAHTIKQTVLCMNMEMGKLL